jgi:hypothetical protein
MIEKNNIIIGPTMGASPIGPSTNIITGPVFGGQVKPLLPPMQAEVPWWSFVTHGRQKILAAISRKLVAYETMLKARGHRNFPVASRPIPSGGYSIMFIEKLTMK